MIQAIRLFIINDIYILFYKIDQVSALNEKLLKSLYTLEYSNKLWSNPHCFCEAFSIIQECQKDVSSNTKV